MNDAGYVLDASAVLALLQREPGWDRVTDYLPRARISTVNLSEVVAKLKDKEVSDKDVDAILLNLDLNPIPFEIEQAMDAGKLRSNTRSAGLSFADRACLALAMRLGAIAVTADRAWSDVQLDVEVELIR